MKASFVLLFITATILISCTKDSNQQETLFKESSLPENSRHSDENSILDPCLEVDLFAGQFHDAGNVIVNVDNGILTVTYETEGDWELDATHLYVGACNAIPVNRKGNPKIGRFPYKENHPDGTTSVVYSIDVSNLPNCICIAAHAVVSIDAPGTPNQVETAWGDGTTFPGGSWAMYFDFCLDQCTPTNY